MVWQKKKTLYPFPADLKKPPRGCLATKSSSVANMVVVNSFSDSHIFMRIGKMKFFA